MGLITTEPVKIGEDVRQPGYELTPEDMEGRNISMMKRQGVVKFVEDRRGPGRPRKSDSDDE